MGGHRLQQGVVVGRGQTQLVEHRLLGPHQAAQAQAAVGGHLQQGGPVRRLRQVVHHLRLDAMLAQQLQRAARVAAARVVPDRHLRAGHQNHSSRATPTPT